MADFDMAALLGDAPAPPPDQQAWAEMSMRSGLQRNNAQQYFVDVTIPPSIYDTKPNEKLEASTEKILSNPNTYKALCYKALGSGVSPMTFARQQIAHALTHTTIDFHELLTDEKGQVNIPAGMKRKKEEDQKDNLPELNQILRAWLRDPSYTQLSYHARSFGISTLGLLIIALDQICETPETLEKLKDSEEAMKLLHEAKKKKTIIGDFLTQV